MEIGKVPENVLKRSVFKKLTVNRPEVLIHPGVGEDCSVLTAGEEAIVLSTDPITGTAKDIGSLAFHITANDIASSGAELIGMLLTIIFPPGATEKELKKIMQDITALAEAYQVEILGGHTEVSAAVNQTLLSVTGVGKAPKDKIITTGGLKVGQDIVVTKWIGLEGTSILAKEKEGELTEKLPREMVETAKSFSKLLSVVPEGKIAADIGVSAMHDVTEGGIFGALWEMAAASGVGLEIDLKKIPIRQETIEVCEVFDINPYMLISSGSMLIGTSHGNQLVEELARAGIHSAVVGYATEGNDRVIRNGEERRFLEPPKKDELFQVL
ncbi:MAG: AIR synthase family protein [Lachnospiraceae bacterium]|nr:AIR synthase family protein [Lachnospiraceae bacterium]